uniref:NADH dehydrogenase subunit 6 n=1 Tax=Rhynchoconger ectenurus TaxID=1405576 RepID=UPI001E734C79|nr:NADH dehydrogenase subunit 6 [Rhynchoconger ectenurus]UDH55305.1 NADH dehydrogenase subunit 6 [Rhynchoconger ectenurus]
MSLFILLFLVMLVLGVMGVSSNPSPYFAALGLVTASAGGCGILAGYGGSFVSLVLFLIYLGGMLVVFAYSAALAAEAYPVDWSRGPVFGRGLGCLLILFVGAYLSRGGFNYCGVLDEGRDLSFFRGDFSGVSFIYSLGGGMLVISGWVLLLTLFVVLELTRGRSRGALRSV